MSSTTNIDSVTPGPDVINRAARLGAEVCNIRLSGDLSDDVLRAIGRSILEHKVIFFRDQHHFDDAEQERLSVRLDRLISRPQLSATDRIPCILAPSSNDIGRSTQGRADVTSDEVRSIAVLRAVMATPYGGAMGLSNTAAAYDDLPLSMRMLADELWAVHANADRYGLKEHSIEVKEAQFEEMFTGTIYETTLPVVLTHPQTGERMLMLGSSVCRFVGLQTHTGQKLLDLFHSYIRAPHNSVRWKWRDGDVAIWDNRLTQSANDHSTAGGRDARSLGSPPCLTRVKAQKPQAARGRAAQARKPRLAPDYALRRATRSL
ncbi:TauD/TfdA dioxygenase family protein [Bradyrhizobium canariense]|uniref:TauD/TfdA dioxygenase family protein n=1 Tax=Bradyrhizobium canariense TaxID=255045 RepID=UPI000A193C7E|nr:TauD/TfdA family dioxygenase [Bradyrhizobium canariense]OSI59644.1 hypothetical protein BSZ15_03715 [Bradyrhizobium canariense]